MAYGRNLRDQARRSGRFSSRADRVTHYRDGASWRAEHDHAPRRRHRVCDEGGMLVAFASKFLVNFNDDLSAVLRVARVEHVVTISASSELVLWRRSRHVRGWGPAARTRVRGVGHDATSDVA